jgi:transcriptional regulator with XRE-family HTH domain
MRKDEVFMDKKKTGNLIRDARTKKNYTQVELGDLLGVSNKAVSRWENGESFPDVGILEELAAVLDVRIEDIVTGNAEGNKDAVVNEVVRIAKLQQREVKREIKRTVVRIGSWIAAIICSFISGCFALGRKGSFFSDGESYVILMSLSFVLTLVGCALQNETDKKVSHKFCKGMKIIALLSFLWSIVLTWCVFLMIVNGHTPFGMKLSSVGPFVNWQLIGLFTLNLLLYVLEIYRYERCGEAIHWGCFLSIATMYATVLYGDLLHRLDSIGWGLIESLALGTAVVLATTGISLGVAKIWKARK